MLADLRSLILSHEDLSGLIVAWGIRPQGSALPAIVLNIASDIPIYTYAGPVSLRQTRVQADIYAADVMAALTVHGALEALLSGYAGTVGGTKFEGIFLVSRFDEPAEQTVGAPLYRISRDLMVNHKEA